MNFGADAAAWLAASDAAHGTEKIQCTCNQLPAGAETNFVLKASMCLCTSTVCKRPAMYCREPPALICKIIKTVGRVPDKSFEKVSWTPKCHSAGHLQCQQSGKLPGWRKLQHPASCRPAVPAGWHPPTPCRQVCWQRCQQSLHTRSRHAVALLPGCMQHSMTPVLPVILTMK